MDVRAAQDRPVSQCTVIMETTAILRSEMVAAFAEWQRWYREDPDAFVSAQQEAAQGIEEYGEAATATLMMLIKRGGEG